MKQRQHVIQGIKPPCLQKEGSGKEEDKPQGQMMVKGSSFSLFFRKEKEVEKGGRQEVERAVFQKRIDVRTVYPEGGHMMVTKTPQDEGCEEKGYGQPFFYE